jgi:hypothetical protein
MAEIIAKYDTNTKKLSVTKDGQAVSNVMHVQMGRTYDTQDKTDEEAKHECSLHMMDKTDDGYMTHTHITANEQGDLVKEDRVNTGLSKAISSLLGSRR